MFLRPLRIYGTRLLASQIRFKCTIRAITTKIEKETEPYNYETLPIDVPGPDPIPSSIDDLVEEILNLNVIEYGQFLKRIQLRSGIADETMLSRFGNTMLVHDYSKPEEEEDTSYEIEETEAKPAAAAVAEPVKEKEFFDIKLGAVDAKAKIKIIKEVRTITSLGLKEAKELVEKAPVIVKTGVKKEEAEKLKALLVECGAVVELL